VARLAPLVLGAYRHSAQLSFAGLRLRAGGDTPEELKQTVCD
jgi:hypothetical protein